MELDPTLSPNFLWLHKMACPQESDIVILFISVIRHVLLTLPLLPTIVKLDLVGSDSSHYSRVYACITTDWEHKTLQLLLQAC